MATNNKKLLWVGVASAVLIGGGLFWWYKTKKDQKAELEKKKKEEEEKKKREEEAAAAAAANVKPPKQTYNPPPVSNTPKFTFPFKNTTEGNEFRKWVNDNYPAIAKKIDLAPSGELNSYVQKAWDELSDEWNEKNKKIETDAKAKADAEAKKKAQADALLNSYNAIENNLKNDKKGDTLYNTAVEKYTNRIFVDFTIDKGAFYSEVRYGAIFYNNSRFVIKKGNEDIKLGTYYNGGKKIVLDNGRIIESGSIWSNIVTAVDA